jgi:hypothetical protein
MLAHRCLWVLALAALASAGQAGPARAGDIDRYLPADTAVYVNVNVRQVLDSPLIKKHALQVLRDALKDADTAEEVLKDLGLDPFKDVDRVIVAGSGEPEPDRGLVIVHGRFDPAKFQAKAQETAKANGELLKLRTVPDGQGGRHTVYEVLPPDARAPLFVTLADNTTLLLSAGKDYVVDALKKRGDKAPVALKEKDLQALLEKLDDRQSVTVAAVNNAATRGALNNVPDEAAGALEKITAVGGGVTLGEDIKAEVAFTFQAAADARDFRDSADQGLRFALAGLAVLGKDAESPGLDLVLEVVKSLKVSAKGKTVLVKGQVSAEAIEEVFKAKDK